MDVDTFPEEAPSSEYTTGPNQVEDPTYTFRAWDCIPLAENFLITITKMMSRDATNAVALRCVALQ
jgi:hypothetical protein